MDVINEIEIIETDVKDCIIVTKNVKKLIVQLFMLYDLVFKCVKKIDYLKSLKIKFISFKFIH